ncbi:MAG: hypothetical protein U9R74_02640 [Pseudomonadota bacterium]|nr:hypothetical protein [Pseudomonadota bacterium]
MEIVTRPGVWLFTAILVWISGSAHGAGTAAACADKCVLGETRSVAGETWSCRLYSTSTGSPVPLSPTGMHDRARQHDAWIRKYHLPAGSITNTVFSDTTYTDAIAFRDHGDSAEWTGLYLASQALKLQVTGSPDAERQAERLVESIHRLFAVTGIRGMLARYAAPLNSGDPRLDAMYDPAQHRDHTTTYDGQEYFWVGDTSRDMYQGVALGYGLAYEALGSPVHRELIRSDVVKLLAELIQVRRVPMLLRVNFYGEPMDIPVDVNMRYSIPNPRESVDGRVIMTIGSDGDPLNFDDSSMRGLVEFWPDYAEVIRQVPGLGFLARESIPNPEVAVMLASMFRVGILVTEGVPGYEAAHRAIRTFYDAHIQEWIGYMRNYTRFNPFETDCGQRYYGLTIVFEPIYNLIRLEDDPVIREQIRSQVLEQRIWPLVKDHKNVFFSYVQAGLAPPTEANASIAEDATAQLGQFDAPPQPRLAHDVRASGKYPPDTQCPGQSTVAVDVADRAPHDFIWQRSPFVTTQPGEPRLVYPTVDYVFPYWLGRYHGFVEDDAEGTCLRWLPAP